MTRSETCFELGPGVSVVETWRRLQSELSGDGHAVREHALREESAVYLDTHDFRLLDAGLTLELRREDRAHRLRYRARGAAPRPPVTVAGPPQGVDDLPPGPLADALADVVPPRRLLQRVAAQRVIRSLDVLDGRRKTVVRVELVERRTALVPLPRRDGKVPSGRRWKTAQPRLVVRPVRGYEAAHDHLVALASGPLGLHEDELGDLRSLLFRLGLTGRDPSRFDPQVEPDMSADDGVRTVLRRLHEILVTNEPGVVADLDSEFLHDFRVAARRTRSLLTQTRGLFPLAAEKHYIDEFRWLGSVTGPTRDLDVLLEKLPRYLERLPAATVADLAPLAPYLRELRAKEQRRLETRLRGKRWLALKRTWGEFLEREPTYQFLGAVQLPRLATARIEARRMRILELGRDVDERTPPARLHRIRLQGKKLRYLLEAFGRLFPRKERVGALRELRRFQRVLGDFNDYEVHARILRGCADSILASPNAEAGLLLGIGQLVGELEQGKEEQRRAFAAVFAEFKGEGAA